MRRSLVLLALLVIVIASSARPAAAACPVDTLAWMAGSWSTTRNGIRSLVYFPVDSTVERDWCLLQFRAAG